MELIKVSLTDDFLASWNDKAKIFDTYRIYHSVEWFNYILETQKNIELVIYKIVESGTIIGYLPGFILKKGFIKIFASPFEGWNTPYMGPLINKDTNTEILIKSIYKLFKSERVHYAQFAFWEMELDDKYRFIRSNAKTNIAELGQNPEEILDKYSKTTRKCVRKAIKNDLIVEATEDIKFIDYYYDQLCQVFAKRNLKPTYTKDKVRKLWNNLMPTGKLIATWVLYNDKVIATRLDFYDSKYMHSFGSASDQDYLKLNPNELARYFVMCKGCEKELLTYDMTGGGDYKQKFGAEEISYCKLVYDPYALTIFKSIAKKIIKLKFKKNNKRSD